MSEGGKINFIIVFNATVTDFTDGYIGMIGEDF